MARGSTAHPVFETLATLRVRVELDPEEHEDRGDYDKGLLRVAKSQERRIEARLRDRVAARLGPGFDAEVTVHPSGSIEIVGTILIVSSLVGSYSTIRQALLHIRQDFKRFLNSVLEPVLGVPLAIDAHYELGEAAELFSTDGELHAATAAGIAGRGPTPIPLPSWALSAGAVSLFLVVLAWLIVPLLLIAGVF